MPLCKKSSEDRLWEACFLEDIENATRLVRAGAEMNSISEQYGMSPFVCAVRYAEKKPHMVQELLELGGNPNAQDDFGVTPLMEAVRWNPLQEITLMLLDAGGEINSSDDLGNTSLIYSTKNACDDIPRALLEAGADVNAQNHAGMTPLMFATVHGDPKRASLVKMFLEAGADVNARDHEGKTALILSARDAHNVYILKRLAFHKKSDLNAVDSDGRNALLYASYSKWSSGVKMLLNLGADANLPGPDEETPLMIWAREGDVKMIEHLLIAGADATAVDVAGESPVHWAVKNPKCSFDVIKALGGNREARSYFGRTAFQDALQNKCPLDTLRAFWEVPSMIPLTLSEEDLHIALDAEVSADVMIWLREARETAFSR